MYNESNNYCEVLISPPPERGPILAGQVCLAAGILAALLGLLIHPLLFLAAIGALALSYQFRGKAQVEYEYQFWGRQLDIETITNGDRRRSLVTYSLDEAELLAQEEDPVVERYRSLSGEAGQAPVRDLTNRIPNSQPVYLLYAREGTQLVQVRLQPTEEMLRHMWRVAPSVVHIPSNLRKDPEEA